MKDERVNEIAEYIDTQTDVGSIAALCMAEWIIAKVHGCELSDVLIHSETVAKYRQAFIAEFEKA